MIDLHLHSTASDGTLTPTQLVRLAEQRHLHAIALTDHDTTDGIAEFLDAGQSSPVRTIPGVEVACSWYQGSLHLLGLFIDHHNPVLAGLLEEIRRNREDRNARMLQKIKEQGIPLEWEEVLEQSGGNLQVIGRPHFARALVDGGHCGTIQEAFEQFIGRDAPCHCPRFVPLPERTIDILHQAGATVVVAHPFGGAAPMKTISIRRKIKRLKSMGIDGMEVFYSDYTRKQTERALKIATELGLLKSGGSDFHGDNMTGIELGTGYGKLNVPDDLLPPLENANLPQNP